MNEWPSEKKERAAKVFRALPIPPRDEALEFGCGDGIFTEVLRRALPEGWKVRASAH